MFLKLVELVGLSLSFPVADFVAIQSDESDPITNVSFRFVNMTMYDYFIYHHYYSARSTWFNQRYDYSVLYILGGKLWA